jgi:hypothetical protein
MYLQTLKHPTVEVESKVGTHRAATEDILAAVVVVAGVAAAKGILVAAEVEEHTRTPLVA